MWIDSEKTSIKYCQILIIEINTVLCEPSFLWSKFTYTISYLLIIQFTTIVKHTFILTLLYLFDCASIFMRLWPLGVMFLFSPLFYSWNNTLHQIHNSGKIHLMTRYFRILGRVPTWLKCLLIIMFASIYLHPNSGWIRMECSTTHKSLFSFLKWHTSLHVLLVFCNHYIHEIYKYFEHSSNQQLQVNTHFLDLIIVTDFAMTNALMH